jgi:hypothetical protein
VTALEVVYRYITPPGESVARALDKVREVYGIRRITFQEAEHTVRVEFDASRLNKATVANLLRGAGMDLGAEVALV